MARQSASWKSLEQFREKSLYTLELQQNSEKIFKKSLAKIFCLV